MDVWAIFGGQWAAALASELEWHEGENPAAISNRGMCVGASSGLPLSVTSLLAAGASQDAEASCWCSVHRPCSTAKENPPRSWNCRAATNAHTPCEKTPCGSHATILSDPALGSGAPEKLCLAPL